jgi:regulatory protein
VQARAETGESFFVRPDYLGGGDSALPREGAEISPADAERLLGASRSYLAERAALALLARSEHSRLLLCRKLLKKHHDPAAASQALDYLEASGRLSDARYARAWLSERGLKKVEGRRRLEGELAKRGIPRETAAAALDEFFSAHDEAEACRAESARAVKQGLTPDRAARRLLRLGFDPRLIRRTLRDTGPAAGLDESSLWS